MKKKALLILSLIIALFLCFHLFLGVENKNWLFPYIDTKFSKDFTFDKWDKVRNGMNREKVIEILGEPIGVSSKEMRSSSRPPCASYEMYYSSDGAWRYADFAWQGFEIFLDTNNIVIAKSREWHFD